MKIDKADWAKISALLDEALELEPSERLAWLDALPRDKAEFRSTLEQLLSAEAGDRFSDAAIAGFVAGRMVDGAHAGQVVAGYRQLRLLGHGGMGAVWLAERVEATFKRQVALKLLHPALVGASFVERFHRERDILAQLNYSDIARIYDAGVTETGQPFLALEYVEGDPINRYCDDNRLTVRARLELFQRVLAAVQHAHGELIVHRDIKPSNIFVSRDGEVRLLDFGIAKFVEDTPAEATALTRVGGRLLTPEYASPEQVAGKPVGIASDIYSLGVVLYELLTGRRPYRVRRESLGALEDALLSGNFVAASDAIDAPDVAERRGVSVRRLRRLLKGDIEAILAKALRTDARQRYPTCEAFDRDLARYLGGEVVLARRGSRLHRFTKFVRRNWMASGAVATICIAIAAGTAVALWQASIARENAARANAETVRAERERAVAVAVKEFLVGVFRVNDPETANYAAQGRRSARDVLADGIVRLQGAFDEQPDIRAELYDAVIDILVNLQDFDQALALARENVAYTQSRFTPRHERYAAAVLREAIVRSELDQVDEARRLAGVVEKALDASDDRRSALRGRLLVFAGTRLRRAGLDGLQDIERAKQGIALLVSNDAGPAVRAQALLDVAFAYSELHAAQPALDALDSALVWTHNFEGADRLRANALSLRASMLLRLGRRADAEASLREANEAVRGLPPGHPVVLAQMGTLGSFLHMYGQRPEGRMWLARSLEGMERAFQPDSIAVDNARTSALHAAVMDGAVADVQRALPALLSGVADQHRPPSLRMAMGWVALRWYLSARDPDRAEAMLSPLATLATDPDSPATAQLHLARSRIGLLRGSAAHAREWANRVGVPAAAATGDANHMQDSSAAKRAWIRRERLLIEVGSPGTELEFAL